LRRAEVSDFSLVPEPIRRSKVVDPSAVV